jgi:hypothetical protein
MKDPIYRVQKLLITYLNTQILANDMKSFKTSLKRFLYNSFYSIEEYYEYNDKGMEILL